MILCIAKQHHYVPSRISDSLRDHALPLGIASSNPLGPPTASAENSGGLAKLAGICSQFPRLFDSACVAPLRIDEQLVLD